MINCCTPIWRKSERKCIKHKLHERWSQRQTKSFFSRFKTSSDWKNRKESWIGRTWRTRWTARMRPWSVKRIQDRSWRRPSRRTRGISSSHSCTAKWSNRDEPRSETSWEVIYKATYSTQASMVEAKLHQHAEHGASLMWSPSPATAPVDKW